MLCQALLVFAPLHQGWQLPIQGSAHAAQATALEEEKWFGISYVCRYQVGLQAFIVIGSLRSL
jgi:hypothetical protein